MRITDDLYEELSFKYDNLLVECENIKARTQQQTISRVLEMLEVHSKEITVGLLINEIKKEFGVEDE